MTETRSKEQLLSEAVRVLTEAARGTVSRTLREGEAPRDEQADFADFLTLAVAGAAANMGGIEALLAGRPGSWEADHVRDMLTSTVSEDERYLWRHRTEPLRYTVNVVDLMSDLGQSELYEDAQDELNRRDVANIPAHSSPEAAAAAPPLTEEQEAADEAIGRLRQRLEEQQDAEYAAYGQALTAAITGITRLLAPDLVVPVEVQIDLSYEEPDYGGLQWQVLQQAVEVTLLPSGIAPASYPASGGSIADQDRRAGRTPLARLESANPSTT